LSDVVALNPARVTVVAVGRVVPLEALASRVMAAFAKEMAKPAANRDVRARRVRFDFMGSTGVELGIFAKNGVNESVLAEFPVRMGGQRRGVGRMKSTGVAGVLRKIAPSGCFSEDGSFFGVKAKALDDCLS
jgi:hypothetical protein